MSPYDNTTLAEILAGKTSLAEMAARFRPDALKRWQEAYQRFGRGQLFRAQHSNADNWLRGEDYADDLERWINAEGDALVAGIGSTDYAVYDPNYWPERKRPANFDAAFSALALFAREMVLPPKSHRAALLAPFISKAKANGASDTVAPEIALRQFSEQFERRRAEKGWNWTDNAASWR